MVVVTQRAPRNIRRNCRNLRILKDVGLVCDARQLAFPRPWATSPCKRCPEHKRSKKSFGELIDVEYTDFIAPVKSSPVAYSLKELEDSEKFTMYEHKPKKDKKERTQELVDDVYTPDQKLIDARKGFQKHGVYKLKCCGALFYTPYYVYEDKNGYLRYVDNPFRDMQVECPNGHPIKNDDMKLFKSAVKSVVADNYYTYLLKFKRNPKLHIQKPRKCAEAEHVERHIYHCKINDINMGGDAHGCATCEFWGLREDV